MISGQETIQRVICDGCGQGTTSGHIAKRLERLEQTTRYRPVHIQAVFLSAQSPAEHQTFLYSGKGGFRGEAAALLDVLKIEHAGRDTEAVLNEFQRKGYLLAHVLECAPESGLDSSEDGERLNQALRQKLPSVLRRLRTSLKPRRLFVISRGLAAFVEELKAARAAGEVVLDGASPFDLDDEESVARLRAALQAV